MTENGATLNPEPGNGQWQIGGGKGMRAGAM
jgi:hypothetical protein